MVSTWYGDISETLWQRFASVRLLICDIDGVFSDGRIYLGNQGEELKAFHTRDGFGVKALLQNQVEVAVMTGRQSTIVESRMQALGVRHIYQGLSDKTVAYQELIQQLSLNDADVAYIGDDVPDLALIQQVGLGIAVRDAHASVQQSANYVTALPGGFGAVREVSDLILSSLGRLNQYMGSSE
ncbi:3-deoxy-manno-octulosonate-8-phosphatase KdsC [Aliidiomarina sedimenti]|uniref:3-deoxy-D-manno-octulosonate 8-phosphate phosphatase KdsC n=1 Tax=Aliidiomarina sedimenti TaxID=1933879 RepID=A0ABY0BZJ8_9GAMM|nr:3-deoxy-manno-octulosonate-8-phosphatase KdsC [Aliidiomarina sedimenti]RUO30598.1 3-deoxy-manno-octulosonate-8-phosphatase KdsC [Aliidiomarina sedimenti]